MPHRTLGWIWVALMAIVAGSSFWIHELRVVGPWSPIHLSVFSLVMLAVGVLAARGHNVGRHKQAMIGLFAGALIIAGLFAFMPGRIMHAVIFGPREAGDSALRQRLFLIAAARPFPCRGPRRKSMKKQGEKPLP